MKTKIIPNDFKSGPALILSIMPDSYLKKANRKDGLHPNLKKRMMTLEEKRIARLRNVKSTGYNNNQVRHFAGHGQFPRHSSVSRSFLLYLTPPPAPRFPFRATNGLQGRLQIEARVNAGRRGSSPHRTLMCVQISSSGAVHQRAV